MHRIIEPFLDALFDQQPVADNSMCGCAVYQLDLFVELANLASCES